MVGSRSTAARLRLGTNSLRSSSHFPLMPYSKFVNPVMFPPGRAKLGTTPAPTGSVTFANTIGTARTHLLQRRNRSANRQDHVWCERNQLLCRFADTFAVTCPPTVMYHYVTAIDPAKLVQTMQECSDACHKFRIIRGQIH